MNFESHVIKKQSCKSKSADIEEEEKNEFYSMLRIPLSMLKKSDLVCPIELVVHKSSNYRRFTDALVTQKHNFVFGKRRSSWCSIRRPRGHRLILL